VERGRGAIAGNPLGIEKSPGILPLRVSGESRNHAIANFLSISEAVHHGRNALGC
jgi:hypothetical protein